MHSELILIWEIVLIGFNSVQQISSHWEKIFSAAWGEYIQYNGGILIHFVYNLKLRLCIPEQALCHL